MASARPRPLSPHLSIFRWRPAMAVSIVHRVTGNGLATVGVLIFLWWLVAAASGQEAYATFYMVATHPLAYVVWVGLTWFFFQHLASGIRHLIMDTGAGYDLPTAKASSIAAFVAGVLLTALTWGFIFYSRG
jgi:succinate dehydrogenase / fumarate reductase, cytochrome b subunit